MPSRTMRDLAEHARRRESLLQKDSAATQGVPLPLLALLPTTAAEQVSIGTTKVPMGHARRLEHPLKVSPATTLVPCPHQALPLP